MSRGKGRKQAKLQQQEPESKKFFVFACLHRAPIMKVAGRFQTAKEAIDRCIEFGEIDGPLYDTEIHYMDDATETYAGGSTKEVFVVTPGNDINDPCYATARERGWLGQCHTPDCGKPTSTHLVSTSTYNETPPGYFLLCAAHAAEHDANWSTVSADLGGRMSKPINIDEVSAEVKALIGSMKLGESSLEQDRKLAQPESFNLYGRRLKAEVPSPDASPRVSGQKYAGVSDALLPVHIEGSAPAKTRRRRMRTQFAS